jgi:hypothetical protein
LAAPNPGEKADGYFATSIQRTGQVGADVLVGAFCFLNRP